MVKLLESVIGPVDVVNAPLETSNVELVMPPLPSITAVPAIVVAKPVLTKSLASNVPPVSVAPPAAVTVLFVASNRPEFNICKTALVLEIRKSPEFKICAVFCTVIFVATPVPEAVILNPAASHILSSEILKALDVMPLTFKSSNCVYVVAHNCATILTGKICPLVNILLLFWACMVTTGFELPEMVIKAEGAKNISPKNVHELIFNVGLFPTALGEGIGIPPTTAAPVKSKEQMRGKVVLMIVTVKLPAAKDWLSKIAASVATEP